MPRYFFHTGTGSDLDQDGTELADAASARMEAIRFAAAMIYDRPDLLSNGRPFRVEVVTQEGQALSTVIMLSSGPDALPSGESIAQQSDNRE